MGSAGFRRSPRSPDHVFAKSSEKVSYKEADMTPETKPEQAPGRTEKPAPAGKTEQPRSRADRNKAIAELPDADLQAVNGGGGRGGIGGEVQK